jgi:hypothetical protein
VEIIDNTSLTSAPIQGYKNSRMFSLAAYRHRISSLGSRTAYAAVQLCRHESSAKASRMARRQRMSSQKNKSIITPFRIGVFTVFGVAGAVAYEVSHNKEGALGQVYYGSPLDALFSWIYANTWGRFKEIYLPADDKLLPDWPTAPVSPPVMISVSLCVVVFTARFTHPTLTFLSICCHSATKESRLALQRRLSWCLTWKRL